MNPKELYEKDNLTQKDIIQLLLHNAQHMVTRDELKEDNRELKLEIKEEIYKIDIKIDNVKNELKEDIKQLDTKIDSVKDELNSKINNVKNELNSKIDNVKSELKNDIKSLKDNDIQDLKNDIKELRNEIKLIHTKLDRFQWLIITMLVTILFKDYIIKLLGI